MAKQKSNTRRRDVAPPTPFEQARDELFQHIIRCGVIGAETEHQAEWFQDTIAYLEDRFPELTSEQLTELATLGTRFAQPPKSASPTGDAASAA
jgi:hypothetical protein